LNTARRFPFRALAVTFVAAGCNQLLDVQDAHVDPKLVPMRGGTTGAAGASSAGTAGSGASGGTAPGVGGATSAGHGGTVAEAGMDGNDGGAPPGSGGKGSSGASGHAAHAGSGGAGTAGTGGAGSGGTGNVTGEGGSGEPEVTLCERYCDAVMTNCKGRYEQYQEFSQCVEVCQRMDPGEPNDRDVDTVECRVRQAGFAKSEPFVYCKSSGPLGAGECGSNCVSYCNLMQRTCTAATTEGNLEPSYFDATEECLASCTALVPDENTPDQYTTSSEVEPASFIGNHVYCRAYHVTSAIVEGAPDEHCPHAVGAAPCN
jgi:hypothetical protein